MIKRMKRLFNMLLLLAAFLLGIFLAGGEGALLQQTATLPETLKNAMDFPGFMQKMREFWDLEAVQQGLWQVVAWLQTLGKSSCFFSVTMV